MACVECELNVNKAAIKKIYKVVIPVPEPAGEAHTVEVLPVNTMLVVAVAVGTGQDRQQSKQSKPTPME